MSTDLEDVAMGIFALIEKAREEGLDRAEYEKMMQKGLTEEQKAVAENRAGEGRIRLTGARPQTSNGSVTIPNTLEQLAEGEKKPWIVELDGVEFVVKTTIGEGSHPHSKWFWHEDGYKFVFYKSRTDDTVHSLEIVEE